ncbi:MAG: hypothetical protein IJ604_08790 [Prevotella sp.]|nr:hypothetical protein [Prevotella sp.]
MANQVTFQIKIETVGGENVKNITMDAEELGRVVKEVTDEQEKLNTKLLDINQAQQAIQNVTSGISQIASEVSKYTAVYSVQETVERKVAQVMRNTMDATEAEIESIKNLCAAQQDLGVIGDEVQMAGAQELATYLEMKSSLEKLIPVMNDMLAQQYGLEASQESAATIATMLGKVMEGQTQALSRYGYSFDETQEKILKFGTEEERAAVLAEVVSQSVGGMNQALAQTDSGKAKQIANTIGDIKEQIGACMIRLEPFVSTLGEIGMGVQGIMSVYQGVRGLTVGITSITIVQRGWNTVTVTSTAVVRTLTTVMRGGTVAATTLRVAIRGLMIATGVGAAITVLTMAIEAFVSSSEKATDAAEDFADAQSNEAAQLQQTRAALEINIAKLKDFHGSKEQEKKIVEEMNNTYGETMGYFSSVAEWYNALIKNSDAYCRQMVIEARTRMLANQIAELQSKRDKQEQYNKIGENIRKSQQEQIKDAPGGMQDMWRQQEETATKAISNIDSQIADLQNKMQASVKELANTSFSVRGSSIRPVGDTTNNDRFTSGSSADKSTPAAEGSIRKYKEDLADLRKQIEETADADVAASLQTKYETTEAKLKDLKIKIGLEKPEPEEAKTYMDSLREQLAAAQKNLDAATTVEARVEAMTKVNEIQEQIDEATRDKVTIQAVAETKYITVAGSDDDKRQSASNAQQNVSRIQQDFEIGLIGKEDAEKGLEDINKQLEGLGLKPIDIQFKTDGMKQVEARMKGATDAVQAMGSSLAGFGDAIGVPELNVAGTMAQAIATMVTGYATATSQAASLGPWAWIAFAALGLAQLTAMITSVKDVAKFADGGVAYGPTLGLFGEYANAATNPEVVAPLDRLKAIIGSDDSGPVEINLRVRGRDLVGVSNKRNKLIRRSR